MKPVLISPDKLAGSMTQLSLFFVSLVLCWYLSTLYSLSEIVPAGLIYADYIEYAVIALSAWVISFASYRLILNIQTKNRDFIVFSVNLAVDGSYHYIKAPADLLTSDFFKYFFIYLIQTTPKDKYNKILKDYFLRLEIRRKDDVVKVLGRATLAEGGIEDGDICQIIGKPKKAR